MTNSTNHNEQMFYLAARQVVMQIHLETSMLQAGVEAYMADYPGENNLIMTELANYVTVIKGTNTKLESKIESDPIGFTVLSTVTLDSMNLVGGELMQLVKAKGIHYASWNYRTLPRVGELVHTKYPEQQKYFAEALAIAKKDHEDVLAGTFKSPSEIQGEAFLKAKEELDRLNDPNQPADGIKFLQKLGIA